MSKQSHSLRVRQTWAVGLIPQGWLTLPSLDVSTLQNSLFSLWGGKIFGTHFCKKTDYREERQMAIGAKIVDMIWKTKSY